MKSKIGYSVILAIIMGISISNASADHSKVDVNIIEGSAVPGCEEKNECYIPYNIIVDAGGEVIWNNNDNAAHTITSGTPNDGPDGLFDSSLFTAGSTFSVIFDDSFKTGNYHYFCMVHPWMEGIVSVEEEVVEEKIIAENIETTETIQTQENNKTTIQNISADGSVTIEIETSKPTINEGMLIDIRFSDYNNKQLQEHMNYDIIATQNEEIVLSMIGEHKHDGNAKYTTMELASDDPVEIAITLQGIGIDEIHGPQGETIEFKVVPEFGSIALMILTISIISAIALTTRSRII